MSCWSAENAKRTYLQALRMLKMPKEFISKLQECAGVVGSTTLALAAAAHQTGGRVVCICSGPTDLKASRKVLGAYADSVVELMVGDLKTLFLGDYIKGADFLLVDCDIPNANDIFGAASEEARKDGALVVGYNVRHRVSLWRQLKASFLPIGEGLLVVDGKLEQRRKSHWMVKVDKCTGEEHIFRVTSPLKKVQIEV